MSKLIRSASGWLTVFEKLSFEIKRVYLLHNMPVGAKRGDHAHKKTNRVFKVVQGSARYRFNREGQWYTLNYLEEDVYIPAMTWFEIAPVSDDLIAMFLASEEYDEADCVRDYTEFLKLTA